MNEKLLEDIGFTEGETKVYLTLIQLGTTTTGPLVKNSGISASKVYLILDRLTKKGLAGHIVKGGVRHFQASEPKRLLDYITQKESELAVKKQKIMDLLPQLELRAKLAKEKRSAEIYEGHRGIKNLYLNIFDELHKGDTYYVIGAGYGFQDIYRLRAFFEKYHTERAKRGIKVYMLANYNVKDILVPAVRRMSEIRFLPQELITNMTIVLYKEKTFIFILNKNPLAFLIHNEEIVQSFYAYFNLLWKIGKKT